MWPFGKTDSAVGTPIGDYFERQHRQHKQHREERAIWARAETLADLGDITARWVEGHITYHPGGYDEGPAEETLEIVPALAALNRSGFVTSGSQPGDGPVHGYDGFVWWQRAAVDGYTDKATADQLEGPCRAAGLLFIRNGPAEWRTTWTNSVPVTACPFTGTHIVDGEPYDVHTGFGTHLSRRATKFIFDGYGADALLAAEQVTIIDPVWGRKNRLWEILVGDAHIPAHEPDTTNEAAAPHQPNERERSTPMMTTEPKRSWWKLFTGNRPSRELPEAILVEDQRPSAVALEPPAETSTVGAKSVPTRVDLINIESTPATPVDETGWDLVPADELQPGQRILVGPGNIQTVTDRPEYDQYGGIAIHTDSATTLTGLPCPVKVINQREAELHENEPADTAIPQLTPIPGPGIPEPVPGDLDHNELDIDHTANVSAPEEPHLVGMTLSEPESYAREEELGNGDDSVPVPELSAVPEPDVANEWPDGEHRVARQWVDALRGTHQQISEPEHQSHAELADTLWNDQFPSEPEGAPLPVAEPAIDKSDTAPMIDEPTLTTPADLFPAADPQGVTEQSVPSGSYTSWQDNQWPHGGIIVNPESGLEHTELAITPELEATTEPEPGSVAPETPELTAPASALELGSPDTAIPELEVPQVQEPEYQPTPDQEPGIVVQDDTPTARTSWWSSMSDRSHDLFDRSCVWLNDKQRMARTWVSELRSGRHQQVCGSWEDGDRECAIQVAKNTLHVPYMDLEEVYGQEFLYQVLERNDVEEQSFDKIADFIEREQLPSRARGPRELEMER